MKNLKALKKLGAGVPMACLAISASFAQSSPFPQNYGNEEDYRRLFFLNTQYIQSYVRSDTATHNRLLWADDFVQQSPEGNLIPKKQLSLRFAQPRFDKIEYFYAEDVIIQFISNDAAMIYATTPLRIKGESTTSWSRYNDVYNDVYIRRDGVWRCVSANIANMTKPGDPALVFTKVPPPPQLISHHPGTEQDRIALTELNARHAEAFARSKSELLEEILAEDFTLLESNGLLRKKQEVIEEVTGQIKNNTIGTYSIENLTIRFVAPDVAMVHAAMIMKSKDGRTRGTQYNDIYVKRKSKWVCVSGNNVPIGSPAK